MLLDTLARILVCTWNPHRSSRCRNCGVGPHASLLCSQLRGAVDLDWCVEKDSSYTRQCLQTPPCGHCGRGSFSLGQEWRGHLYTCVLFSQQYTNCGTYFGLFFLHLGTVSVFISRATESSHSHSANLEHRDYLRCPTDSNPLRTAHSVATRWPWPQIFHPRNSKVASTVISGSRAKGALIASPTPPILVATGRSLHAGPILLFGPPRQF